MAKSIILEADEQELYNSLKVIVTRMEEFYRKRNSISRNEQEILFKRMSKEAHSLHMKLKNRGIEPKHHKYMYENRKVPVEDEEFYNHIHSVQDLLAYINDPVVNDDPDDSTIGEEFGMNIYTRRWGHFDRYTIVRTDNGWIFIFRDEVICNKSCAPGLFRALEHDLVSYPYNVGDFFDWIWKKASEGATKNNVQEAIDDVAEWISNCEKSVPRGMFKELL